MHIIVGLGNPGDEYAHTRHNAGFMALDAFRVRTRLPEWVISKKYAALISEGTLGKEKVLCLLPQTFMNKSGGSLQHLVTSAKKAEKLIVVYDDLDLPLGTTKISFGRGSGGHKGVESIIRAVKTKDFIRVRVGICQTTPGGKLKKPTGEKAILDFLLGDFKKQEREQLATVYERVGAAIETIVREGRVAAMNTHN